MNHHDMTLAVFALEFLIANLNSEMEDELDEKFGPAQGDCWETDLEDTLEAARENL